MYVNTTLYRNSRISRLYCGKTIKDRGLLFGMVPTHILKAKTAKFQVLTPFGSLFFRYPIFKVYTIVYNSAGRFSTPLKTFSSRRVFRPFIEQGASPPVLWSRGASPPPPGGVFFPGGACQRCNIYTGDRRFSGNLWKSATSSHPELKEIETWQTTHFEDK